jgi:hypothetical protein
MTLPRPLAHLARLTSLCLIAVLWFNSLAFAAGKPVDPVAMRAKIVARGVGQGVRVTFADNTDAKGLIVSIADQSFMLKSRKDDQPRELQFAQITSVHNDKLGTGTKIIIVVAIVGVGIGIVAAVLVHSFDSSFDKIKI